jgi:orotidine-5'-phosphate decarboxylase
LRADDWTTGGREDGVTNGFAHRVAEAVAATGPLCAGIDPSSDLLAAWGLPDTPASLRTFGFNCVEAFAGVVPVVKPQVAFFERLGSDGLAALEDVLAAARDAGLLTIADAKRGDIGSTMAAYATAWLDPASPLMADAMTVLPYMGLGALRPAIDLAAAGGKGVIVVTRSSNPEGRGLQTATTATGATVEDQLLADIADLNHGGLPVGGTVGVVIGATLAPSDFNLAGLGGVVLAPGVGAQRGDVSSIRRLFGDCTPGAVLPSASRSLLAAGPDIASLRATALDERKAMASALA